MGTAFEAVGQKPGGKARLQRLHREHAFFRDLLGAIERTLAKSGLYTAEHYTTLCTHGASCRRIFERIVEEHALATRWVLAITGRRELLDEDPVLKRSIRLRNPYVDPLSYLQVEALRKARATSVLEERAPWLAVSRLAVQEIAAGLRNTG